MNEGIEIHFAKVNFHIKEFQKVYILENCKLCFYSPFHLQTQNGKKVKKIEKKGKSKIYLIDEDGKTVDIDKTSEQNKIKAKEETRKKEEKSKNVLFSNDEKGNDAINAYFGEKNIDTLNKAYEEREAKPLSRNTESFKDYDVFYDVYTSKDNDIKSLNEELGYDGFEVNNGIAKVGAEFFDKCFEKGIYVLIPRLVSSDKNEELHFDPVPLEDKGFVVTDFRKGKKGEKNIDLSFQRNIAKIKNPNLTLQSPKEFLQALNENKEFTEDDKKEQAQAIKKACGKKADEITKILLKDDKSLKDVITDKDGLKEKIKELQRKPETNEKLNLLGRLEFLQRNQKKAEKHKDIIKVLQNPQQASNDKQNDKTKSRTKNKQKQTTTPNQEEQKNKNINSKDIGDAGEYAASMLFTKRSTRYLSNRRKIDANFNTHSFNHTIPDFLVTLNDYPTLVEVKNVQDQALTEQISFELKLAREYELDYLFICNHYTKLVENIAGGNVTVKNEQEIKLKEIQNHDDKKKKGYETNTKNLTKFDERYDWGSRRGFIYHRHAHRSIKTIFKEMYLHHIKGAAPNKIIIKRLNLNNSANIEEELNKNKQIQKN